MAPKRSGQKPKKEDPATKAYHSGLGLLYDHPLFEPILHHCHIMRQEGLRYPSQGYAVVSSNGEIAVHPKKLLEPENWLYILAHCLLHLGFEHHKLKDRQPREWVAACDYIVATFLRQMKLGRPPADLELPEGAYPNSEEALYHYLCENGIPKELEKCSLARQQQCDIRFESIYSWRKVDWKGCLARGLSTAVRSALSVAAGIESPLGKPSNPTTLANRAREWFISSYPLLGALAATLTIIEDAELCRQIDIRVAAVDAGTRELFMNPQANLNEQECRFVIAHELLHVGLRHEARRQGRDAYLWNIACDYVINGWLVEMGVGELPRLGVLYDPDLKGLSAEAVYDRVVTDLRRYRKLATLRGVDLGDMLNQGKPDWWRNEEGTTLDEFYRRSLGQGLVYHEEQGRGFLPAGLVEEIRALDQPPVPWDVELAKWFDGHFSPLEKRRTYARPSRRQSATPDIPRPSWVPVAGAQDGRTFGVVLDTSGSMDRRLLAKALGAIASYSMSREVPAVRVVFCDAVAYDQGYMPPECIAERVKVKGRGGTILQPGIDMLERAEDFPPKGPILVITDGYCDHLRIRRDHAFLIPAEAKLPFLARGEVFRIR